jgi:hypothetical protein
MRLFALAGLAAFAAACASDGWTKIRLSGFECGDNCYLVYFKGGVEQRAICAAPDCEAFLEAGALPQNLVGAEAEARFGTAAQVDGVGEVMDPDHPAVLELRLPE